MPCLHGGGGECNLIRFVGYLTIWREIWTFGIKKYISNGEKFDYILRKMHFFWPWMPIYNIFDYENIVYYKFCECF